jgi:hypothetical protein
VKDEGQSGNGKVQRYRARKVTIKSSPKMEVLADGTMLGKGTVKIRLRRRSLRVIAPQGSAGTEVPVKDAGADLPAPVAPAVAESQDGRERQDVPTAGELG